MTVSDFHKDEYEDPVPDAVYSHPEQTNAYAFLQARIGCRSPAVSRELEPLLVQLVGRTLEIAIRSAAFPDPPADLMPWQILGEHAEKATKAIDAAVAALSTLDPLAWRALRRTRYGGERDPSNNLRKGQVDAEADFAAVDYTRSLLSGLAADAKRRRSEWAAKRQNIGDLSRQAFVMKLAELWLFLTGCAPGRSNDIGKNPFLAFVGAAWTDWHGASVETPSFYSQAKSAADALQNTTSWMPPMWTDLREWQGCSALVEQLMQSRAAKGNITTPE